MSYQILRPLAIFLAAVALSSCGGDSSDSNSGQSVGGQNTVDQSAGSQNTVDQSADCQPDRLCVFDEALASNWTMAVYEELAESTSFGEMGTTENSSWSIVESGDAEHGKVIEVTLNQTTGFADFSFQPILPNDITSAGTQSIDLSDYAEGALVFDFRIVNWEQNELGLFLNMQCGWPCRSQFMPIAVPLRSNKIAPPDFPLLALEGKWQEARMPMHYLTRDNLSQSDPWLDLKAVDVISITPPWEGAATQRNVRYQIDNVRIENAEQAHNNSEPPFNFFISQNSAYTSANLSITEAPTVQFTGYIKDIDNDIYLVIDISEDNVIAAADVEIDEFAQTGVVTFSLSQASNLGVGFYSQSVNIRACKDEACNQEYRGSPQRVNVHYEIF